MTREEAIFYIKELQNTYASMDKKVDEAVEIAISALSQPLYVEVPKLASKAITPEEYNAMCNGNNITESANDVVEKNDEVIEHDREWIIGCIKHDGFIKTDRFDKANQIILDALEPTVPTKDCTDFLCWLLEEIMDEENWELNAEADGEIIARKLKKLGLLDSKDGYYIRTPMYEALTTEPSDLIRQETIKELGDWLEQMIQHGVPSHSAKRKALANAIALLSMDTHEIHTETHERVKETHDSDLISRADAVAYPLGFDHYDKENGSREFICGVESYREYIQHLPSVSAERVGEWTKEELKQFRNGVSHKLLEQRSCQHWRYDEETAERIKWLEALERKVIAKMEEL